MKTDPTSQFTRMTPDEVKNFEGITLEGEFHVVAPPPPGRTPSSSARQGAHIYRPNGKGGVDIIDLDEQPPQHDIRL